MFIPESFYSPSSIAFSIIKPIITQPVVIKLLNKPKFKLLRSLVGPELVGQATAYYILSTILEIFQDNYSDVDTAVHKLEVFIEYWMKAESSIGISCNIFNILLLNPKHINLNTDTVNKQRDVASANTYQASHNLAVHIYRTLSLNLLYKTSS